jgi:hypothetical protein
VVYVSEEYRTERLRVVYFHIRRFEGDNHRLCWLRTVSVGPCCNKHWVVYWHIRDLWGPTNLVALMVAELNDTPLYFMDDIGIELGPPTDYPSRFSRGRRHYGTVGSAQLFDSHHERWPLVCLHGSRVVLPGWYLARWLLIQISAIPSDMGEACSLCSNVEVLYHHVHMRYMVRFNYDYLVVKNDDTKNGSLSSHACLA